MWRKAAVLVALALVAIACSSEADLGEACDVPGGTVDVCTNGTVCGRPSEKAGGISCIPICATDDQCPKGADCKGVEGTNIKGCRFKD